MGKPYNVFMEGIRDTFCSINHCEEKGTGKGLDLGAEPPHKKLCLNI